jgi:hypothetical protein
MADYIKRAAAMPICYAPKEELGALPTFIISSNARCGLAAVGTSTTGIRNTYAPLAPLGSGAEGRDNDSLSFGSV